MTEHDGLGWRPHLLRHEDRHVQGGSGADQAAGGLHDGREAVDQRPEALLHVAHEQGGPAQRQPAQQLLGRHAGGGCRACPRLPPRDVAQSGPRRCHGLASSARWNTSWGRAFAGLGDRITKRV